MRSRWVQFSIKMTKLLLLCFSPSLTLIEKTSKTSFTIPLLRDIIDVINPSNRSKSSLPSIVSWWLLLPRFPFLSSSFWLSNNFFCSSLIYFWSLSLIFFCSTNCLSKVPEKGSLWWDLVWESKWWIWLIFYRVFLFSPYLFVRIRVLFSSLSLLFSSSYDLSFCLKYEISLSFVSLIFFMVLSIP